MSGIQPVAVYALRIPPGDIMIPAVPEFAAMFRVTMAAIDPSAEPEYEDTEDKRPPRATLKMVRITDDQFDDDDESDDEDYLDEDEEDSEEENGGPSERKSRKQKLLEALAAAEEDGEEEDEDEDMEDEDGQIEAAEAIKLLLGKGKGKGKAKALDNEDEDDDDDEEDEDDDSEEDLELDEVVLCTLDPEKHYNQPLDFVVGEGEKVFFKVSGTHTIHLTGNYVIPIDDGQAQLYDDDDDEEDEYDLSPDEDLLDALEDEDEESDELDDIVDPRITEVASDDEAAPKLVATSTKGKNKRPANDSDAEEDLDAQVAKSTKKEEPMLNGETKKLSKAEKKAAKKLKKNDGEAAPANATEKKAETSANGTEKKTVQFAKNLEQGPTPSATPPVKKEDKKEDTKKAGTNSTSLGVRNVNGVTVDDRKIGSGPGAKKNSKVEMRYIGKLENGKVFGSNKSNRPFAFKLGTGEVIKGLDIGIEGISAGGERRITIPAHLAYGSQAQPGIPKNSTLIFDVKCLSVK